MGTRRERGSDIGWVAGWILLLWIIELVDLVLGVLLGVPGPLDRFGVWPRSLIGVVGIPVAPFLHVGWGHLIANSVPLLILGSLACAFSRRDALLAATYATAYGGLLAWLIGPAGSVHLGASSVVFGLAGFLILSGALRRGCLPIVIAALVIFLFGGALLGGMMPVRGPERVSWEMHVGGFLGGITAAWGMRKRTR